MTIEERARAFVVDLFVSNAGERAERLVLTSREGKDLGGWSPEPIVDRIAQALRDQIEECAEVVENFRRGVERENYYGAAYYSRAAATIKGEIRALIAPKDGKESER